MEQEITSSPVDAGGLSVSQFDTGTVTAAERFQTWQESMGVLFDLRQNPCSDERSFFARLTTYRLNNVLLAQCASRAQAFNRPSLKISGDNQDHYLIQVFTRGQCTSTHGHKELTARRGDIWVIDLAADYTAQTTDFENISLVVPRSLISPNLMRPDDQHRRHIHGDLPLARMFKQMVCSFIDTAPDMTLAEGQLSVPPMLRMAESLLNSGEGGNYPDIDQSTFNYVMLAEIKRFIDDMLRDPGLRPDTIVAHFGISRSRLYRLFEPLGGVAAYVRSRRLRRSVQDLLDPAKSGRRIYEIAYEWGFDREGDYSRAFRRQYGVSPREARAIGGLHATCEGAARGPFGDRYYESWLLDLTRE